MSTTNNQQRLRNKKALFLTYPHCGLEKEEMVEMLKDKVMQKDTRITYIIVAAENHADGSPHRHVYMLLDKPIDINRRDMRMFDLRKNGTNEEFHPNIQGVGSPKDCITYVKKCGAWISDGICPYKEVRSTKEKNELYKTTSLVDLVDKGEVSLFALPQLKRAIEIYQNELLAHEHGTVKKVFWYYGETGSGKTRTAIQECENQGLDYWLSNADDKWFDGYTGQKAVIIDDIRASNWDFSRLLRLTDRTRILVPVKGGHVWWRPEIIYITAPGTPREVYSNHSTGESFDGIEQLERRICETREFTITEGEDVEAMLEWK